MSIASPSSEFIYDEYVEGRGVKMTNGKVEMPKQAYLKEHHNLIKLLKETAEKLTNEANEQQAEIRGKGCNCCSNCRFTEGLSGGLNDNIGELHAVVIHKPITVEEAKSLASNFIKTKKHFFRETKHSFRFRNIPKTKFIPKSFRTKVVNKQISLIYGELKTEGAGLKDTLVNVYNRMKRNPFGIGIAEYCGPATDLSTDRAPTSSTDAICKTHDYDYNDIGQKKKEGASQDELARLTREADNKMLEALKTVKEDKYKDKLIHFIANSGISLKTKLEDMGLLNPTRFSAGKKPSKRATVQYLVGQGLGADVGRFIYDYMLMPYWQFLKYRAKEYIKGKIDSF